MKKILVIGSLNMDVTVYMDVIPAPGETLKADSLLMSPGGKGGNQACAAARLGAETAVLGAVGNDAYGEALLSSLKKDGVDVSGMAMLENVPTGTAVIFVEKGGVNRIAVVSGTNRLVDRAYIDSRLDYLRAADVIVMQMEIPVDTVLYAAKLAKGLGKTVIVDPAPASQDIPAELWQYCDYIKPNETELSYILTGSPDGIEVEAALKKAHTLGAGEVWASLGDAGICRVFRDGTRDYIPACKVEAVDTTAAGDVFTAAAAVGLASGKEPREALSFACRAAAVSVTRKGAQQSIPTASEVEEFFS